MLMDFLGELLKALLDFLNAQVGML